MKSNITSLITLLLLLANTGCKKETSCEGCIARNKPPIAVAGPDQTISLPLDSVLLDGSASDDPDGKIISWSWKRISGPASVNIIKPAEIKTIVRQLEVGTYLFELSITDDGGLTDTDTVQVAVAQPVDSSSSTVDSSLDVNVYIAGHLNNLPVYWKNGEAIFFDRSSVGFIATDIAVSENKIYMSETFTNGDYKDWRASYWNNGVQVPLGKAAYASSIAVSGDDVYVAGFEWDAGKAETVAKYWKNGQPVALTDGTKEAQASAIAVSGNDVYVVGMIESHAVLWKNGTPNFLTSGTSFSFANDICIYAHDVYVSGNVADPDGWWGLAAYWKNGQLTTFDKGGVEIAYASSIAVVNGDVYVAGVEQPPTSSKVWKNGKEVLLTKDAFMHSIAVYGSDIYTAGWGAWGSKYCKNGKEFLLGNDGGALGIVVVPH